MITIVLLFLNKSIPSHFFLLVLREFVKLSIIQLMSLVLLLSLIHVQLRYLIRSSPRNVHRSFLFGSRLELDSFFEFESQFFKKEDLFVIQIIVVELRYLVHPSFYASPILCIFLQRVAINLFASLQIKINFVYESYTKANLT